MKKVIVCLADGFEEIEAIGIIDILRRSDFQVTAASVTGSKEVNGAHHIRVFADEMFENVDFSKVDMMVLPGGMPGAQNLKNHQGLREKVIEFSNKGKMLGAICAAPMVFGDLGLLENRKATCYPGFEGYLKGAEVTSGPVVEDGAIVTGCGPGFVFEFTLKLVEKLAGKDRAESTAGQMLIEYTL
jgi:protein deglycase